MAKPNEIVCNVSVSGAVDALHMDVFDLGFLGNKEVHRASEIVFDEIRQSWRVEILHPDGKIAWIVNDFAAYEAGREWEVMFIQSCYKQNMRPYDPSAWKILEESILSRNVVAN